MDTVILVWRLKDTVIFVADLIAYAFVGGEYLDSFCSTYHGNTLFSIILHIISDPIIRTYYLTAFES